MTTGQGTAGERANWSRFRDNGGGFYESYFLRGNHPDRPLAFWIRYTLFSPQKNPGETEGELWGVVFDGERSQHRAFKAEVSWADCKFEKTTFNVRIGEASLDSGEAAGSIGTDGRRMAWSLRYSGDEAPLYLMPKRSYAARFPAAKALVSLPMARFEGAIEVDGERISVDGWTGSQNHNWGTRHTDRYAWGQVAGFDTHPESFLEVATARVKLGPFWAPPMTLLVLRHNGEEFALNKPISVLRAKARSRYFNWKFKSAGQGVEIAGEINATREDFVGLCYRNPIGGTKTCLNSKIAACKISLRHRSTGVTKTLRTETRAAFEILTNDSDHSVPISV